jgi:hypothetical protein
MSRNFSVGKNDENLLRGGWNFCLQPIEINCQFIFKQRLNCRLARDQVRRKGRRPAGAARLSTSSKGHRGRCRTPRL